MGWRNALSKLSFGGGANQQPQSQSQPQLQLQPQSQAGAEQGGPDAPIDLEQELHHSKERPRLKKRDSILDRIREKMSPGRRDLQRTERSGAISKGTRNKRNMELQRQVSKKRRRHSVSESEDDTRLQRNRSPRKPSGNRRNDMEEDNNSPHWISNLFTFIGQHPTVPHILSFYAQFAFNVFLLGCCAYLIYCFWSAVQGDIDKKAYEATAEILAESAACLRSWQANKCELGSRVPALEKVCEGWEACMNRDANKIGRARVSAHTFAEIFNSFVEPISWKAMVGIPRKKSRHEEIANIHDRPSPQSSSPDVSQRQIWHLAISGERQNNNTSHHNISTFHHRHHKGVSLVGPWRVITVHLGSNLKVLWSRSQVL